ncbi:MAG TPA: fibronectin type III domain-containing protein [Candidatus Nitrosotalea sp.]|nr:fibronectin type III domain-containing protein [Candidatus Nitrosotalea sp.]
MVEEYKNRYDKYSLTLVFTFIFLFSFGILAQNAFADSSTNDTVIYHDDYSSNTGWTQVGTQVTVDSPQSPGMVKFNNVSGGGGTTEERVYKQLPSTLPAYNWVLETNYMFTSSSIPLVYPIALTIDSSNPEVTSFGTSAPNITIFHGLGTDQIGIVSLGSLSSTIPVSPNVQYYLKLERTQTQIVLFVFSDSARTQQIPGSPVFLNFDSTKLPNLDFIQHSGSKSAGPARIITAQITNTTIYQANLPNSTISTLPASPTGLVARDVSPTQINLSWTAPNNNGNSPITGYKIYRSTSSGTETLLTTSGNFTLYNDTGVTTGVKYFYKVSSVNPVGESSQSNEASATTHSVSSAPQNLSAATVSSSQIYLSWTAPSSNGGSQITGYRIERSSDGGSTWNATVPNTGSAYTKYTDSGLTGSITYTYRVSAINSAGASNPSNTASATTNSSTPPPPPNQIGTIYHDDYSSNTGWTQVGTQVTVDSPQFPGMVKFNNVSGGEGATEERVYKQLPSTLPAYNWVLETNYMFTSSSIPLVYPVALTIDSNNPEVISFGTSAPAISIFHGLGTDQIGIESLGLLSSTIHVSPNVQYYLKLERTSSQLVLFVFSDSTRLVQVPGSPVVMNFDPTALHNLNFIQHSGSTSAGSARTITAQVTDTTIYVTPLQNVTFSSPSPPTGLTATSTSSSQINLSWTAPSSNGGSQITGYKIERSTDGGTTWNTIVTNTGSIGTTYSDTGLSSNTTYTYRVSAINSVGASNPSNTASATTSASANSIVLNSIRSTSGTVSSSNQITLANVNAGTGNNRLLVVGVETNNNDVVSVTFGGVQLSQAVKSFYNNDAEFWYMKNPAGTGDIVVTTSGSTSAVVGAYSLSGVDQTNPIPTSMTNHNTISSSPTISLAIQYPNSLILDLPSIYGGVSLGSPTCTQSWDVNMQDEITGASSSTNLAKAGSVSCSWTASDGGDLWDDAAIEIKASP